MELENGFTYDPDKRDEYIRIPYSSINKANQCVGNAADRFDGYAGLVEVISSTMRDFKNTGFSDTAMRGIADVGYEERNLRGNGSGAGTSAPF